MAQEILSVRMDKDLKKEFGQFCEKVGLSISSVINMYARKVVDEQKIPFEISAKKQPDRQGYIKAIEILKNDVISYYPEQLSLDEVNIRFINAQKEYLNQEDNDGFKTQTKQELIDGLNGMIWIENLAIENSKKQSNGVSLEEINEAIDEVRRGNK